MPVDCLSNQRNNVWRFGPTNLFPQPEDLAATAAFIHEISNGRFRLGIGVTHGLSISAWEQRRVSRWPIFVITSQRWSKPLLIMRLNYLQSFYCYVAQKDGQSCPWI